MAELKNEYSCSLELVLDIIGGRWKVLILWHLNQGTMRFGELKKVLSGITQKMLTQQLRELEQAQIIERKVYAQVPPKVEYSSTQYGKSLQPILHMMCDWGNEYSANILNLQTKKCTKTSTSV
ncbi:MAG: helix-turn-helix transcriptional regulator [Clostridia bacterium]|nr:helix-turn-helix transcriptional regulator [Clostridia bacterium]